MTSEEKGTWKLTEEKGMKLDGRLFTTQEEVTALFFSKVKREFHHSSTERDGLTRITAQQNFNCVEGPHEYIVVVRVDKVFVDIIIRLAFGSHYPQQVGFARPPPLEN